MVSAGGGALAAMSAFLSLMVVSRLGSSVAAMVYAGSLPFLLVPWAMSAAQAGSVQAAFNLSFGAALLICSWAADRVGARRVFEIANWAAAIVFVACAVGATDYRTAVPLFAALGFTLGASYAPALMLVSQAVPPASRGSAFGWVLAGQSVGYFVAISLAAGLVPSIGYRDAWLALALMPLLAAITGSLAARPARASSPRTERAARPPPLLPILLSRRSLLLTGGYTAHCWELLGMWAWAPTFLTIALAGRLEASALGFGILLAAVIHLSGALATIMCGGASDRLGRKIVLVATALLGCGLSMGFGWASGLAPAIVLLLAALYGFATIADSGVLSTAMSEAVPAEHLGTVLAVRSLFGFGAGAAAPLAVGYVLDWRNGPGAVPTDWVLAFAVLGLGGALAACCAALLPPDRPKR